MPLKLQALETIKMKGTRLKVVFGIDDNRNLFNRDGMTVFVCVRHFACKYDTSGAKLRFYPYLV